MHRNFICQRFLDHILNNSGFLTACPTFLKPPCHVNKIAELYNISLWQISMICCSFNGCEQFLIFFNKFPFLSPYIYNTKVTELRWVVSSDESTILVFCIPTHCSTMRSVISWWVKIFLSLFITFRTNVRMSIIPLKMFVSICSPFGWSLKVLKKNQM